MNRRILKHIFVFSLLGLIAFGWRQVFAQDFGTAAVNEGLGGSLVTGDPRTIAGRIINVALGILGTIAVGFIMYAGFLWMSSNGEEEKISQAKRILRNGLIGLAIILSSWAIATFLITRLGGAISGSGGLCVTGEASACGCGGYMYCTDGRWGACIGSDCSGGGGLTSCDGSSLPGCQATPQKCGSNSYCDQTDCGCKPLGNLGDPCDADESTPTCDAANNRCGSFLTCNADSCLCEGPPVILEVSPAGGFCSDNANQACRLDSDCSSGSCDRLTPNGARDNFLTILGKNFGSYEAGLSRVVFEGGGSPVDGIQPQDLNLACINTWQDDQIVIAVPAGAASGAIRVVNQFSLSDATDDDYGPPVPDFKSNSIVRPGICHLSPNKGVLSSEVGYRGINLFQGDAYFGNYQNRVRALDSVFTNISGLFGTSTTPNIQPGTTGSFVETFISGRPQSSNYLRFTKEREPEAGPYISSFSPVTGNAGQYVTISGSGFGGTRGANRVYIGNLEASYDFPPVCANSVWRDNQVIVKVPGGLPNGPHIIRLVIEGETIDSQNLNPNAFVFDNNADLQPSVCKIDPDRGPVATPVALWGEYFGRTNDVGLAKFNYERTATGTIRLENSANKLETSVPVGAISGPVQVFRNSLGGNSLNFSVGECRADSECGAQVCCPQNTYKQGRCVDSLSQCLIDIPNSVFEWNFSTTFVSTSTPGTSCANLANYFGACQAGMACPNVPGKCSPYAGGGLQVVGSCDLSCTSVPGCDVFGRGGCTYNQALNACVRDGSEGSCDLAKLISYTVNGVPGSAQGFCNADGRWEINLPTSCPDGWTRGPNNRCYDLNSSCSLCAADLTCQNVNGSGRCASAPICPSGANCQANPTAGQPDRCVVPDKPSCDCCCEIGQSERDCCAGLTCGGSCGADTGSGNPTLGRCGGCMSAGSTQAERDAACNCTGHSGQFCDINNPGFPDGVCTDCSGLSSEQCLAHSDVCCLDSRGTADTSDDICRGGNGQEITTDPGAYGFGYCAYYNCGDPNGNPPGNPNQCAAASPTVIGSYSTVEACIGDCAVSNPCAELTTLSDCQANSRCCYDAKAPGENKCRLGSQITGSANPGDNGHCAYYNCEARGPLDLLRGGLENAFSRLPGDTDSGGSCAVNQPTKDGLYSSVAACERFCADPPSGPGSICVGNVFSRCESGKCNFPGFGCFAPDGQIGGHSTDCGSCCCQPDAAVDACAAINPNLQCLANQGNCSGGNRGLCCGCSSDNQCGSPENVGCGVGTCCEARPNIASTSPAHLSTQVCRNAVLKVSFDQLMDIGTFASNVLLLEERDYGNGVCPTGTFVAAGDSVEELLSQMNPGRLVLLREAVAGLFRRFFQRFDGVTAALPSANKLYCSTAALATVENDATRSTLTLAPQHILAPGANYYLIVLGDTELNSRTGVLSLSQIGFNGQGYFDPGTGSYIEGELIKFNNRSYKNSQIIKFSTLGAQGPMAGICAIEDIVIDPPSYLFQTTDNDPDEEDGSASHSSFDTKADRDKAFRATAYSADGQALQPVTGYFWDWNFSVVNTNIASLGAVSNLPRNQALAVAKSGVTDGETQLRATVNMGRFTNAACNSGSCSCQGPDCTNNCCNAFTGGDGFNRSASLYVFLCRNPWPPVAINGVWSPWTDNCDGSLGGACAEFNYKFYYCRDNGSSQIMDDLPAIINQPIIRGTGSNLACSADRSSCSAYGSPCGPDKNGDGAPDGICVWNVLKESYFFHEAIPLAGEILSVTDLRTGGRVRINWRSAANDVSSYKIYYLESGRAEMLSREVPVSPSCSRSGNTNNCSTVLSGLTNDKPYFFKISVISANQTESPLSLEMTGTPTDKTAPAAPTGLSASTTATAFRASWTANVVDTSFYRLYRGIAPSQYGESFDSGVGLTSLSFPLDRFSLGTHYFALSALDQYRNESPKSAEMRCEFSLAEGCSSPLQPGCLRLNCCTAQCAGKCGGVSNGCGGTCTGPCPNNQNCVNGICQNQVNLDDLREGT